LNGKRWPRWAKPGKLRRVTTVPAPKAAASRGQPNRDTKPRSPQPSDADLRARFDWHRIAYLSLVSRALDDVEEATNKNKTTTPRDQLVLYQFSSRGHEVAQIILGSLLDHRRDAASAYYRSRPLLLALGLTAEDALASPLGRAGGFSDGRDIGVVCNLPTRDGPIVLPMSGDVGSQFTPCAGWAQSIGYHATVLGDDDWSGAISVVLGGDASVATNGFWSSLTMATTLSLPMLFYIEDNGLGISVRGDMQTPGANIAANLASFGNLFVRDGDGTEPGEAAWLLRECVDHVRSGKGPALVRLTVPRLCSHSGPDNQRGYRSDEEIASDHGRDPLPRLRDALVPSVISADEWATLEADVARDVGDALERARARAVPNPDTVHRWVYADDTPGSPEAFGGLSRSERSALDGNATPHIGASGDTVRFAEAVRRTLRHELEVNPKVLVFGEDVGRKGGVHLVTEGLQKQFGDARVFDTSLSEEGIIGRAVGMAISGLVPVTEIQFRKYADPAAEQLNNCGTLRWRTANRFAAPIVVRMPGGFGKDVGDPWHSLSDEVRFAHAYGWQVAIPSNAADAVGLLRSAMRSANPTVFFEHRSLLMTSDGSARYPGDEYVVPFGKASVRRDGSDITVVSWGALVHRCADAADRFPGRVELLDLRTIAPWDRERVLDSVERTGRCVVVHEDTLTAGFGAEVAATLAKDAFWYLDAPIERVAVEDVPMPYHPVLLDAVLPSVDRIAAAIERVLGA
jgi:2-oxoisovalerate dehydrogenase E1 component